MGLLLRQLVVLIFLCGHVAVCGGQKNSNSLTTSNNNSISGEQLLVSPGGTFALGFFTPGNGDDDDDNNNNSNSATTTKRYVGIWFNNIPEKTVVWVANRENPVTTASSGVLRITDDGNVAVLDGDGLVLWSSNVTNPPKNTTATLRDTGNFVLTATGGGGGGGDVIWQSFDHPTDTLLQGMKLRFAFKTGIGQRVVSWKNSSDPTPGDVSAGFDPNSPLQIVIWKGPEILWRFGIWDGKTSHASTLDNSSSVVVDSIVKNDQEIYYSYAATEQLSMIIMSLEPKGVRNTNLWDAKTKRWTVISSQPSLPCEVYNRCGSFGTCDSGANPACRCLQGFEPNNDKDWDSGNFSGGCVRQIKLNCDAGDRFVKFPETNFPDKFTLLTNLTALQCEAECKSNCECTAYAYSNLTGPVTKDLRCLLWHGELIDLSLDSALGGDLYVRIAHTDDQGGSSKRKKYVVIIVPSFVLATILLVSVAYFLWKRFKSEDQPKIGKTNRSLTLGHGKIATSTVGNQKDITALPLLDFDSILTATSDFSLENKLGEGGFGPVYKGKLLNGQEIAVKRLSKGSGQGFQEFKNEIELIGKLQHTNLVRLLGWCTYADERILMYEYLPNKSLDKFIFDPRLSPGLNWSQRYRIIEGIAQGLLYLHKYSRVRIIHRDLKTSNILLDHTMNPKISDFGLARIFGGDQTEANTKRVVGTYGYMSPEYALDGLFSEKSDVFSFGVIVLEIITGKRSTGFYPYKESLTLLGYVWQLWEDGRVLELVDQSIGTCFSATEVTRCIQVGLLCVQGDATDRPVISSVISFLTNENATLPTPRQPAFAIERQPNPASKKEPTPEAISLNELTTSTVQGR